jgi:hypothetical protein
MAEGNIHIWSGAEATPRVTFSITVLDQYGNTITPYYAANGGQEQSTGFWAFQARKFGGTGTLEGNPAWDTGWLDGGSSFAYHRYCTYALLSTQDQTFEIAPVFEARLTNVPGVRGVTLLNLFDNMGVPVSENTTYIAGG